MDTNLAKRLAIELRIEGTDICHWVDHLEISISTSRTNLHPELQRALAEMCK
jgi:hypothetical protein